MDQRKSQRELCITHTSLMDRLKDATTLLGLLVSHSARDVAAIRKMLAGTIVRVVSSKSRVKSKC